MATETGGYLTPLPHLLPEEGKPFAPKVQNYIDALTAESGINHPLQSTLWSWYVTALYLDNKKLTPQEFEQQFFTITQALQSQKIALPKEVVTTAKEEKKIGRRSFLHKVGFVGKELAIIGAAEGFFSSEYARLPKIIQTVFAPELQMKPDTANLEYNPKTFFKRLVTVIGNSNTGHSDRKGDMANTNDQHPPQKYEVDAMEERFSDLHWQLFDFGENGADEIQIMEQVQSPLFRILQGEEVAFADIAEMEEKHKQEAENKKIPQRPLNRSVKVYVTDKIHPALRQILEEQNTEPITSGHFYPFTITSQKDIDRIRAAGKGMQAMDVGKSTEGDTIVNNIQFNPAHPEYANLLTIVQNTQENPWKRVAGTLLLLHLAADSLDETSREEAALYTYLHNRNEQYPRQIENVISYPTPSLQGQKTVVMGYLDHGKPHYEESPLPQDELSQLFISGISKGINNAGTEGYEIYKATVGKPNMQIIRPESPIALQDHQHYTIDGYKALFWEIMQRSIIKGKTFEELVKNQSENTLIRR